MSTMFGTVSGKRVNLLAPDWREIDLDDIARGLSQVRRFAGQSRRPFSVGQHSLVVADLARPQVRLAALLHDAHEALLGDWTAPGIAAVLAIGLEHARAAIGRVRRQIDVAIARAVLEEIAAISAHGLAIEATLLADEMAGPWVSHADDEALRLEMAIREQDALQNGPSPAISRALSHYGVMAPDEGAVMRDWLQATRAAAAERYGDAP